MSGRCRLVHQSAFIILSLLISCVTLSRSLPFVRYWYLMPEEKGLQHIDEESAQSSHPHARHCLESNMMDEPSGSWCSFLSLSQENSSPVVFPNNAMSQMPLPIPRRFTHAEAYRPLCQLKSCHRERTVHRPSILELLVSFASWSQLGGDRVRKSVQADSTGRLVSIQTHASGNMERATCGNWEYNFPQWHFWSRQKRLTG